MKNFIILSLLIFSCSTAPESKAPDLLPAAERYGKLSTASLDRSKTRAQYESQAENVMVSTQGTQSTQAGLEILKKGGNLFDAFAAVSFAIGVERPQSTGLGGGGFLLFYSAKDKEVLSLDFRETAPRKAFEKMFLGKDGKPDPKKSLTGGLAIATPGLVSGVLEIHKKYGKLPLTEVMAPAIRMAEEGFAIYPALARAIRLEKDRLASFQSSREIFLDTHGELWPEGHILIQKDLAQTLKIISKQGASAFYRGLIARKISRAVKEQNGILDSTDLANYKTRWRKPVVGRFHGYDIYSQPPPSSGGVHVIEILNTLEKDPLKLWGPQDPRSIHLTASAMQRAFFDRARFMGDPDFVKVPSARLTSKTYAEEVRKTFQDHHALTATEVQQKAEAPETTHFSLMDAAGNTIASTQTINGYFGSALVAAGTGIVLNNEMDDFSAQVGASNLFGAIGGKNNMVQPLKRPLSSMSPTIVMKNDRPILAVGTPSGTKIITCVTQTLLNALEYEQNLWEAVTLTRYHQQWQPDELQIEDPQFSLDTMAALEKLGYKIVKKDLACRIQAIQKKGKVLHGVSDPREEGSSQGF